MKRKRGRKRWKVKIASQGESHYEKKLADNGLLLNSKKKKKKKGQKRVHDQRTHQAFQRNTRPQQKCREGVKGVKSAALWTKPRGGEEGKEREKRKYFKHKGKKGKDIGEQWRQRADLTAVTKTRENDRKFGK